MNQNKYFKIFQFAFKQNMAHRGAIYGRFAFFGVILFIFSRLWFVVGKQNIDMLGPSDLVWYLAFTELIILSTPLLNMDVEEDVRSGNVVYIFVRPANYLAKLFFEGMGQFCARLSILYFVGLFFPFLFTGTLPTHPWSLLVFLPLALCAGSLYVVIQICVGLCAFWLQDSSPIQWVTQKFLFILGGMFLPLSLYPKWAQNLASLTPFPSMLALPATSALIMDMELVIAVVVKLLVWFIILLSIASLMFRACKKNLTINGG